jgi:hypothetical protein
MRETTGWVLSLAIALVVGSVTVGLLAGLTWRVAAWVVH